MLGQRASKVEIALVRLCQSMALVAVACAPRAAELRIRLGAGQAHWTWRHRRGEACPCMFGGNWESAPMHVAPLGGLHPRSQIYSSTAERVIHARALRYIVRCTAQRCMLWRHRVRARVPRLEGRGSAVACLAGEPSPLTGISSGGFPGGVFCFGEQGCSKVEPHRSLCIRRWEGASESLRRRLGSRRTSTTSAPLAPTCLFHRTLLCHRRRAGGAMALLPTGDEAASRHVGCRSGVGRHVRGRMGGARSCDRRRGFPPHSGGHGAGPAAGGLGQRGRADGRRALAGADVGRSCTAL